VTWALIGINVAAFLGTAPRRAADNKRYDVAAFDLVAIEVAIEGETRSPTLAFENAVGLREETTSDREFWRRFEAGRIVPIDSVAWTRWDAARAEVEAAKNAHFDWAWGFRREAPSAVTLFTSAFMHADFWHLFFNMLFLWVVGVNMEEEWGRRTFLILYAFGIVASGCAVFFDSPAAIASVTIGASGAIAAVMGAFAVTCFRRSLRIWFMPSPLVVAVPAWICTGFWFGGQLYDLGQSGAYGDGGTAVGVHALGFVVGAGMALALKAVGADEVIAKPQEAQRRQADKTEFVEQADAFAGRNDVRKSLEALARALVADPDDPRLRRRKMLTHSSIGEHEAARAEGLALLERLWSSGDRAAFADAFAEVDEVARGAMPAGLVHRAAMAFESLSPVQAAALYVRVARDGANDPVLPQSLRRYALLLDKVGEPEKARQVRALLEQVDARRRS
jgi:membrane associated rhomboid family serine protease